MNDLALRRRALRIVLGVLVVYAALVATHQGEFWPFSIYQMFSSAGRPWSRALVVALPPEQPEAAAWQVTRLDALPGPVVPLDEAGISQNDLAAVVAQPGAWDEARRRRVHALFAGVLASEDRLLVYRVQGAPEEDGGLSVRCIPVLLLSADTVLTPGRHLPAALPEGRP